MKKLLLGTFAAFATLAPASALDIEWNYSYDTHGFFNPQRRAVLDAVAAQFSHISIDSPDINAAPGTWTWGFFNPTTGVVEQIAGSLSAGKLIVYVGADDLGGALGTAGPAWSSSYTVPSPWSSQIAALNTLAAFKPFAGSLTISNNPGISWYDSIEDPSFSMSYDLFTVVTHELGHILGIGATVGVPAWQANITSNGPGFDYTGSAATTLYGGNILLTDDGGHLDDIYFEGNRSVMNEALYNGERRYWSALETAILSDLGYTVIPEPGTLGLLAFGAGIVAWQRRRKAA